MSAAVSAYWLARDYKLAHNKLPQECQTPAERRASSAASLVTSSEPAVGEKRNSSVSSSVRKLFHADERRVSGASEKQRKGSFFSRKN